MSPRPAALACLVVFALTGCASAPASRQASWYVAATYAPPTHDLHPALAAGLTTQVTSPARSDGATLTFPPAMAAECTGAETCRHAAVKTEITVSATPTGPGRFRLRGTLLATVGRHVVVETPPGMAGYQRSDTRVLAGVEVLAEGTFPTPFDQVVGVDEPLEVGGFHGSSVTLRVIPDPVAAVISGAAGTSD